MVDTAVADPAEPYPAIHYGCCGNSTAVKIMSTDPASRFIKGIYQCFSGSECYTLCKRIPDRRSGIVGRLGILTGRLSDDSNACVRIPSPVPFCNAMTLKPAPSRLVAPLYINGTCGEYATWHTRGFLQENPGIGMPG